MVPGCSDKSCDRYGLPMKRKPGYRQRTFECPACGAETMESETPPTGTIPSKLNTNGERLLDEYYHGLYGHDYKAHLNSGEGPFDKRRRRR